MTKNSAGQNRIVPFAAAPVPFPLSPNPFPVELVAEERDFENKPGDELLSKMRRAEAEATIPRSAKLHEYDVTI